MSQEGAGKAGCRLAPAVRCAKWCAGRTAQRHTGEAQHTAFPARWVDGLCRALPGAEFLLASLTPAKVADTAPVDAHAASAKAWPVATTARTTRFCRTRVRWRHRVFPRCRR